MGASKFVKLDIYHHIANTRQHIHEFRSTASQYTEIHRLLGGNWQASWRFEGEGFDQDYGKWWFYSNLGKHFERSEGGNVEFSGIVDEVEMSLNGSMMRMDLTKVANAVKAIYRDPDGVITEMTSWTTNPDSIALYGRREHLLVLDWMFSWDAQDEVDTYLAEWSYPKPEFISILSERNDYCQVRVSGYVFTLSYQFVTVAYTDTTIKTYFTSLINTDAPFLTLGSVDTNDQTISTGPDTPVKVWDEVQRLTDLREDPTTPPFLARVDAQRYAHFEQLDVNPKYIWERGALRPTTGGDPADLWKIRPGIIRDPAWGSITAPYESYLQQGNDMQVTEVRLTDGMVFPILTNTDIDAQYEAAFATVAAQDQHPFLTDTGRGRIVLPIGHLYPTL